MDFKMLLVFLSQQIQNIKKRYSHNVTLVAKANDLLMKINSILVSVNITNDMQKDIYNKAIDVIKECIKENADNQNEKAAVDLACKVVKRTIDKNNFNF